MWGCAEHDVAEGIHRPLVATALACQPHDDDRPLVLLGLDWGWWRSGVDEWSVRGGLLEALSLETPRLLVQTAHTHAGPATSAACRDKPGGDLIEAYLRDAHGALRDAACEAVATVEPATVSWTVGRCNLAANRDLPDPGGEGTLCGYHPDGDADDTVLVGRLTNGSGATLATIVNYACHPTSLGGGNRLISPDYVGALREVVESAVGGAPCLFLQGASGELAPRRQYASDPAVADDNGRQLGYAVLSALAGMLPPGQALSFRGAIASGAPLGIWDLQPVAAPGACQALEAVVELDLKEELLETDELAERLRQCRDRVLRERLERACQARLNLGSSRRYAMPLWGWRLGDALLIGMPAEAYSVLQVELRRRFPDRAVVVANMINGHASYLAPAARYGTGTYQADISPYGPGCLEKTLAACIDLAGRLAAAKNDSGDAA
jgi:hypothetical protein